MNTTRDKNKKLSKNMIPLPVKPKIVDKKENYASFVIEGLYPGYGVTVGNGLRRVLLSSLPGAAVTQMKIKGGRHEFSTIPGVLEDVITIMLKLKQMRFKIHSAESQKGHLAVSGQKTAKAGDFQLPTQVELINKDLVIATLTDKKAELDIEIQIEPGIGYEPSASRKREKLEIGAIALDAIFTPVKKVSFKTEHMRVGERTDFDRLFLEVETDGAISPEEALAQSCDVLVKHFSAVGEGMAGEKKKEKTEEKITAKKAKQEESNPSTSLRARKAKKAPDKKVKKSKKS